MLVLLVLSRMVFGRSLAPGEGRNEQLCTGFQPCAHSLLPIYVTAPPLQHHSAIASYFYCSLNVLSSHWYGVQLTSCSMVWSSRITALARLLRAFVSWF